MIRVAGLDVRGLPAFRNEVRRLLKTVPSAQGTRATTMDALAKAIGMSREELSRRLNGQRRITIKDVHAIVRILAEWAAITDKHQALELFALLHCPEFAAEEWAVAPLKYLSDGIDVISSASAHLFNVPFREETFVGREDDIRRVMQLVKRHQLVTLVGTGGAGKTRLAVEVAHLLRSDDAVADSIYFVDLSVTDDIRMVPVLIGSALHIKEQDNPNIIDAIKNYLKDKRTLLILDNFEHLLGARFIVDEIRKIVGVNLLVTSREHLQLIEEHEYLVSPLATPDMSSGTGSYQAVQLRGYPAVELMTKRIIQRKSDFIIDDESIALIAQLCSSLDGLPLGIELVAAWAANLGLKPALSRLNTRMMYIGSGLYNRDVRHSSIKGMVEWSYNLLNDEERKMFKSLGVFAGTFSDSAVAALYNGVLSFELETTLTSLVDKNLIRQVPSRDDDVVSYSMLDIVRSYARMKLAEDGVYIEMTHKLALYYSQIAQDMESRFFGSSKELEPFLNVWRRELDNIRHLLVWCCSNDAVEDAIAIVSMAWRFWYISGRITEGSQIFTLVYESSDRCDTKPKSSVLYALGTMYWIQGDTSAADDYFRQMLVLCRATDYKKGIADALHGLVSLGRSSIIEQAIMVDECIAIRRELGDDYALARLTGNLANGYFFAGDYERAEKMYRETSRSHERCGNTFDLGSVLFDFAEALTNLKRLDEARSTLEQLRTHCVSQPLWLSRANGWQAMLYYLQGDFEPATEMCNLALQMAIQNSDHFLKTYMTSLRAALNLANGSLALAYQSIHEMVSLLRGQLKDVRFFQLLSLVAIHFVDTPLIKQGLVICTTIRMLYEHISPLIVDNLMRVEEQAKAKLTSIEFASSIELGSRLDWAGLIDYIDSQVPYGNI